MISTDDRGGVRIQGALRQRQLARCAAYASRLASALLAVVGMPANEFSRITVGLDSLGMVFDRPTSPGNVGTLTPSGDFHPSLDGLGDLADLVGAHLPLHRAAALSCEYLAVVCAIINEQRVSK